MTYRNKRVILHTDLARTYSSVSLDGVLHDRVVHKKKPISVAGKKLWLKPQIVKIVDHRLKSGYVIRVNSGTQLLDMAWRSLKQVVRQCKLR